MDIARVRFAPSPTGFLHIGNARTALYNWIYAKGHGGKFILRIEDTDVERSKKGYLENILQDLRWLGITWDEGPDVGGEYGPYVQSDRLAIYSEFAKKLLDNNLAYYCYCAPAELEKKREKAIAQGKLPKYDSRCLQLTQEEKKEFEEKGVKPAVRFRVPEKILKINDLIRGEVVFDTTQLGDFVIMKSDGGPTFNFAVCVDDYLMKITHVIRGEDHLPNTPKHALLFEAIGAELPHFAHLPMILGAGGKRLSKREQAVSVYQYRETGYLPEALSNYIALLGWAPSSDKEIESIEDMAKEFELTNVSKSASIFDVDKLNWINGEYIRSSELDRITNLSIPYFKKAGLIKGELSEHRFEWLKKVVDAVRDHLHTLGDVTEFGDIFFKEAIAIKDKDAKKILKEKNSKDVLLAYQQEIDKSSKLDEPDFKQIVKQVSQKTGAKGPALYKPLRAALTGTLSGPELVKVVPVLGKSGCITRINDAVR